MTAKCKDVNWKRACPIKQTNRPIAVIVSCIPKRYKKIYSIYKKSTV